MQAGPSRQGHDIFFDPQKTEGCFLVCIDRALFVVVVVFFGHAVLIIVVDFVPLRKRFFFLCCWRTEGGEIRKAHCCRRTWVATGVCDLRPDHGDMRCFSLLLVQDWCFLLSFCLFLFLFVRLHYVVLFFAYFLGRGGCHGAALGRFLKLFF